MRTVGSDSAPPMTDDPDHPHARPSHPRWPAIILLTVVSSLLLALAVLSTFGQL